MLSVATFVVSDVDDREDIFKAWQQGKTLDPLDFSLNGYPVDPNNYPVAGKALLKGKFKLGSDEDIITEFGEGAEAVETEEGVSTGEGVDAETEEVGSSAEEDEPEGSERDLGLPGEDVSPLRTQQPIFRDLPRTSQESRCAPGRGRGHTTRKRKGPALAKESPKSRFSAEAAEILALKKKFEEEQAARSRMEEEFRQREARRDEEARRRDALRDEEAKKRHEDMMAMFAMALKGIVHPNLPATPQPSPFAQPSARSVDAGTLSGGDQPTDDTQPPAALMNDLSGSTPLPPTSLPLDTVSEGDDQEKSSGPSST